MSCSGLYGISFTWMYAQTRFSSQSASGWIFQTPYRSDHSTLGVSAREGDWSRRIPEIHASYGSSARTSGSTLRMWQQRSGFRSHRFGSSRLCCSATVSTSGRISVSP